jgi:uncharacterized protein YciI
MWDFAVRSLFIFALLITSMGARSEDASSLFVVHFETGPAWQAGLPAVQQPGFSEHAKNLQQLRASGALVFGARYQEYGMVFLAADNLTTAKEILDADPGVKSGMFLYQVAEMQVFYPWRSEAELPLL